jgi:hypothetical protein
MYPGRRKENGTLRVVGSTSHPYTSPHLHTYLRLFCLHFLVQTLKSLIFYLPNPKDTSLEAEFERLW